jgi:hypothetical protein
MQPAHSPDPNMPELIVLSPLAHALHQNPNAPVLNDDTGVTVLVSGLVNTPPLTFFQALQQYPKAEVLFHPIDAPLHIISLPPLPATRREAALRVKLEDLTLEDPSQLTLSIQALGQHHFAVLLVSKTLLAHVQTALNIRNQTHRVLSGLSASLPHNSEHRLNDHVLWRDAKGAGAMPTQTVNTSCTPLDTRQLLNAKSFSFQSHAQPARHWALWRWPLVLLAACALVGLLSIWLNWRQGLAQLHAIQTQTNQIFKAALPNEPLRGDPVKLLNNALGIATNEATSDKDTSNPSLMKALSYVPAHWPSGAIIGVSWKASRLNLTLNPTVLATVSGAPLDDVQKTQLTAPLSAHAITVTWSTTP